MRDSKKYEAKMRKGVEEASVCTASTEHEEDTTPLDKYRTAIVEAIASARSAPSSPASGTATHHRRRGGIVYHVKEGMEPGRKVGQRAVTS